MKALLVAADGLVSRIDLPNDMHERNERIKKLLASQRLLYRHTELGGERAMKFMSTANDSTLYTGQTKEGWECDVTPPMIRAAQQLDAAPGVGL